MTPDPTVPSLADNRREHQRHGVLIRVRVQDEDRLRQLYATDLSKGGLFLASSAEMEVGQRLRVALVHPLSGADFEVLCEVANVRRRGDGGVMGAGLRFVAFDEEAREALFMFVEGVVELEPDEELEVVEEPGKPPPPPPEATSGPARARSMLLQARKLAREGNLVGAAHVLSRASALAPSDEAVWEALRQVEGRLAAAGRKAAPPEDEVSVDVELGDLEEPPAEGGASEVLLDEPATFEPADRRKSKLLFEAARDCYGTGDIDDAIGYLERSLGVDPTFLPSYCALARIVADAKGDRDRAEFLCGRALELDPSSSEARAVLDAIRAD